MNTTQLRYFLELAQTLNYSAAAQQLYVTQPTLSRSIMSLEEEIGAKLFYRENGNVSLTPAGRLLRQEVLPLSMRYEGMLRRVRNVGNGLAGELHIALSEEQQLPSSLLFAIKSFSAAYPYVEFRFSRMNTNLIRVASQEETLDKDSRHKKPCLLSFCIEVKNRGQPTGKKKRNYSKDEKIRIVKEVLEGKSVGTGVIF